MLIPCKEHMRPRKRKQATLLGAGGFAKNTREIPTDQSLVEGRIQVGGDKNSRPLSRLENIAARGIHPARFIFHWHRRSCSHHLCFRCLCMSQLAGTGTRDVCGRLRRSCCEMRRFVPEQCPSRPTARSPPFCQRCP